MAINRFLMLSKILLQVSIGLFLYSCNKGEHNLLGDFKNMEDLNATDSISLDNYEILNPHYIYLKDSFLIFNSAQGNREIQLLSLKDHTTCTYSVIGQGKNEMNNYFTVSEPFSGFYKFADNYKGKIYGIDITALKSNSQPEYKLIYSLPINERTHFMRFMETENYIVGIGILENGRFGIYDKSTFTYSEQADYPSNDAIGKLNNVYKGALFSRTIMSGHPQGKKFVAACFGLLDFYAISDSGKIKLVKSKYYHFPKFKTGTLERSAIAYKKEDFAGITGLVSDEKYVYALYSDKTFEQENEAAYNASHLLVYDWEGNLVMHYRLCRELYAITKSENILYGLSRVNNPIVYCCELNL